MTKTTRILAIVGLVLTFAFNSSTASADDGIPYAEPPGAPATAMAPDPGGCYGQDVYGGWWPCYYQFPDFCINPQEGANATSAYFFFPCTDPGVLPNIKAWCALPFHATHPNCIGLPKTGPSGIVWLLGVGAVLSLAGIGLRRFAHRRQPSN